MIDDLLQHGGLSLDRLQSFCRVAEAGGVTKAAKGDPARQSLFSRQIKELEEFFGVELVRRSGRGVVLTEEGRRLHALAREELLSLQDFKQNCAKERAQLTLAAGDSVIQWLLLPRLPGLLAKLPNVSLRILNLSSAEIASGLGEGTLDIGIVRAGSVSGRIKTALLGSMQFALFIPLRLLGGKRPAEFTPVVVSGLPFAVLEGEGAFRSELARLAERGKVRLDFQIELSSFPLVAKAVQTGVCAAVLPELARSQFNTAEVAEVHLDWLRPMSRQIVLAWNPRLARIRTILGGVVAGFRTVAKFD
jgi:DNA-binding transcriptional LysR family regulator